MEKQTALVQSVKELAEGIHELVIKTSLAKEATAGQFIGIFPKDKSKLLARPLSICDADEETLKIVYRVSGEGTKEISTWQAGDDAVILGILGNGYNLSKDYKKPLLMGGGIGIPPMLLLAKKLNAYLPKSDINVVLGYRNSDLFLKEEFEKYATVHIATEDGSVGTKGNVLDLCREKGLDSDVICACGPMGMLRAIKAYADSQGVPAYISLEERMACGVGACLGCVVKTKEKDHHSNVNNARICTDGPVFLASDLDI